jgi:cohesin loading factor subunit SCC2
MEVFQNMWFTPVRERPSLDSTTLLRKVMNITDVVAASRDMGLEWFEQLLLSVSTYRRFSYVFCREFCGRRG